MWLAAHHHPLPSVSGCQKIYRRKYKHEPVQPAHARAARMKGGKIKEVVLAIKL